ncbi:MAG: putative zinc-binding protein, partial [Candidatus Bathyarchaeia archaeon]
MAVEKPKHRFANKIVIAPCSGVGQTVGTISRQAAYEIVDKLAPSETVLLCLPAYNIEVDEDVEMVKQNPMKIIAIEGCARLCRYCQVIGVAGVLFSVWCGLMKLYHKTKSLMKSLILKIGFFLTGKLLKNLLVRAFMVLNQRSMRFLS